MRRVPAHRVPRFIFLMRLAGLGALAAAACDTTPASPAASCQPKRAVADQAQSDCASCSTATLGPCTEAAPLDACCTWVGSPAAALTRATALHRFAAAAGQSTTPDLTCMAIPGSPGDAQTVTLTGYVWAWSTGMDTAGVTVQVYEENAANTDGTLAAMAVGGVTTKVSDPVDPIDTRWDTYGCPDGCGYRRFVIPGVPTETALVLKTSDAIGGGMWATAYEYNVVLRNEAIQTVASVPTVSHDATAVAAVDVTTVAAAVGLTANTGVVLGEVHDCAPQDGSTEGIRLQGASVGSNPPTEQTYYFDRNEAHPLLDQTVTATGPLGAFALFNPPTGAVRVTAVGQAAGATAMLGTYVVQVQPGAVTLLTLQGRRPWQQ
jgi:hypothetical protein